MRVYPIYIVLAGALLLNGCGADASMEEAPSVDSIDVKGEVVWKDGSHNNPCFSAPLTRGVTDLVPGATVTIRDAAGSTVALGKLGDYVHDSWGQCTFEWYATEVPTSSDFYSVEVANRGQVNVSLSELEIGVSLRIG